MTNLLKPYSHSVIVIPVEASWITDVEGFGRWVSQQEEGRNPSWAKTRRICLIAFACYYRSKELGFLDYFKSKHKRYSKFPSKTDYYIGDKKIKIVHASINENWNIGPEFTGRVTENAYKKGNDLYVLICYNVDRIVIMGWMTHEELRKTKERGYYHVRENNCHPMYELEEFNKTDELRWYR